MPKEKAEIKNLLHKFYIYPSQGGKAKEVVVGEDNITYCEVINENKVIFKKQITGPGGVTTEEHVLYGCLIEEIKVYFESKS